MDDVHCLDYRDTGFFSKLICDYLDEKPQMERFYGYFPKLENFEKQISLKSSFEDERRKLLARQLRSQYQHLPQTSKTLQNIQALENPKTFTVTTGHQLNIFTGPLYFLYKIISTLNLSEKLQNQYPDYLFVPVYWMATEDHDFEEINHINLYGGRLNWPKKSGGPVGRLKTDDLKPVIDELAEHLGPGSRAHEIIQLFSESYLQHETLAEATRYLVHQLFGKYGLLIIDGDDANLKRSMIPYFEKDLFVHEPQQEVENTTNLLEAEYFDQVHPREINLFYIEDGLRERIEKKGNQWRVLGTDLTFSENALRSELQLHPEKFSPNVILRPLYQEAILPNLAYIGGGGELAYWFQLKGMFDALKVPFPILMLRNSVLWIPKKAQRKMKEMDLAATDIFKPLHQIKKDFVKANAPADVELDPYEKKLQTIFNELEEVAHLTDKSMLGAVNAQRQKQLNGLENLKKKLIRAEKRRHSTEMEKLENVYYSLFPGGSLQERHDNLSVYYAEYGYEWIEKLKERLDPLDFRFCVINATEE